MKKFCSKCGFKLDLGQRACVKCHAFNPYFISGFESEIHIEPVIKLEAIKPVAIIEEQPEEDAGRILTADVSPPTPTTIAEENFKTELLKVKEETEQYKKETLELVKEVKKELHDIDKENKRLKEKVESLNNTQAVQAETNSTITGSTPQQPSSSKRIWALAATLLMVMVTAFYFFYNRNKAEAPLSNSSPKDSSPGLTLKPTAIVKPADTLHHKTSTAVVMPKPMVASVVAPAKPISATTAFALTEGRVKNDLIGKRLSGCDITINSPGEIDNVTNLALVEKLSSSYLKYKCTVKVKQGSEVFTASPYMYYSAEGAFIKVDGTNCE